MNTPHYLLIAALCGLVLCSEVFGQAECTGWGGLRGIRIDGELMKFTSGLLAARPDWSEIAQTGNELVRNPHYVRDGNKQTTSGSLVFFNDPQMLSFTQIIEDTGPGTASVDLQFPPEADMNLAGVYFFITLPDFAAGKLETLTNGIRFTSPGRQIEVMFHSPIDVAVKNDRITFAIASGNLKANQKVHANFTIKITGDIDKTPIKIAIDTSHPGRAFDGIGGNFRLQSPFDPPIIQYNLDNLRVTWGRVALPLAQWQPNEEVDPQSAEINQQVRNSMEIAQTLHQRKIPLIISVWFAPQWMLEPNPPGTDLPRGAFGKPGRLRGHRFKTEKLDEACKSIGSYLLYLKKNFGVEPELFSFNESDLGIDIRQTPEDHADMIKRLGAYFASQGLTTKMLLGDTSDAHPTEFIDAAMNDPQAVKYISAVSFHCWRGGTDEQFSKWNQAAQKLNIPLFVAEGGTDADAHRYPAMFTEPWFSLDEIDLYVRICRLCQPKSIMEWQLTADYSVLAGGRDNKP
ncbi:MAG TPA: hypothetical protein VKK61_08295, partial [Tepidisphaeraceae bacterium]|nr:hypothetical protein [Tepidisphaeraceae bacterium]